MGPNPEIHPAAASLLQSICELRPVYPVTHLRLQRHLEWEGMGEKAALYAINGMATAGSIILCGPLEDPHPDTPVIPNHLRSGDPARIVVALLGAPDEKRTTAVGGEIWTYVLCAPKPDARGDDAMAIDGVDSDDPEPRPDSAGPPRRLRADQSLVREIELNRGGTVSSDLLFARSA